jgi:hypothetical protein
MSNKVFRTLPPGDLPILSQLTITGTSPGADLTVFDSQVRPVARGRDELTVPLPAGLYRVHSQGGLGGERRELVDLLPGGKLHRRMSNSTFPVVLPIGSQLSTEASSHAQALDEATKTGKKRRRKTASLTVMIRSLDGKANPSSSLGFPDPSTFKLLDRARRPTSAFDNSWRLEGGSGYALASVDMEPGAYTLREEPRGFYATEQSIVLQSGWRTIVVIPVTASGPIRSLASITMCPVHTTWNLLPESQLLMSESVFAALRTGRPAMGQEQLERADSHLMTDPVLAIIAVDQLITAAARDAHLCQVRDRLMKGLITTFPKHPDVQAQAQFLGATTLPLMYPPMLTTTYRRLVTEGFGHQSDNISRGSYAEHAGAASMSTGIWLTWPSPNAMDAVLGADPEDENRTNVAVPFLRGPLERFIREDAARRSAYAAHHILLMIVKRLPLARVWASALERRLAGWDTAGLHRLGLAKIAAQGQSISALLRGTTALTLTRVKPADLAAAAGVPLRLAAAVHDVLLTRLGVSMTISEKPSAKSEKELSVRPSNTVTLAALVILAAFAVLVVWMLSTASKSELVWQRQVYIFASVEAIVFAAAGALFGVQVKRQETAKAEGRTDQAVQESKEAKLSERLAAADAQKGRTIAATTRGLAAAAANQEDEKLQPSGARSPNVPGGGSGTARGTSPAAALRALAHVADELFPPGE